MCVSALLVYLADGQGVEPSRFHGHHGFQDRLPSTGRDHPLLAESIGPDPNALRRVQISNLPQIPTWLTLCAPDCSGVHVVRALGV